jgi:hypothetical protein
MLAVLTGCGRTPLGDLGADGGNAATDTGHPDASGVEALRGPSCERGPSEPTSLLVIDNYFPVQGLAAAQGLVFTIVESYGASPAPFSHIATITAATREVTTTEIGDNFPLSLSAYSGGVLVAAGKVVVNGNAWSVSPTEVIRFVPSDHSWSLLTAPTQGSSSTIATLAGNDALQAFWASADRKTGEWLLERWDPSGQTTQLIRSPDPIWGLQASHSDVYWSGLDGAGRPEFMSVPASGGPTRVVWRAANNSGSDSVAIVGHDDNDLYFIHTGNAGTPGIMAVSESGGAPRIVVPDVRPTTFATDGAHVYWWTLDDQYTLFRSPTGGGPVESVYHGRLLSAVALDECNIYWLLANPCEIYYRAK